MASPEPIDVPPAYLRGEDAAVAKLLEHCFGDSLPPQSRVMIMRAEKPCGVPNTIRAVVLVDGQEAGATVGTWLQRPDGSLTCVFNVFPRF